MGSIGHENAPVPTSWALGRTAAMRHARSPAGGTQISDAITTADAKNGDNRERILRRDSANGYAGRPHVELIIYEGSPRECFIPILTNG